MDIIVQISISRNTFLPSGLMSCSHQIHCAYIIKCTWNARITFVNFYKTCCFVSNSLIRKRFLIWQVCKYLMFIEVWRNVVWHIPLCILGKSLVILFSLLWYFQIVLYNFIAHDTVARKLSDVTPFRCTLNDTISLTATDS